MTSWQNFSHGKATVSDGVTLHYRMGGSGSPLVLLHGWPQHSLMWHSVAPRLAERFTIIAPDLRGVGGSSIPTTGYDKKTMAQDVMTLLTQLGVNRFDLAGYDLGSGVAYSLAAQWRNAVRRLAVMEFGLPGFGYEQFMTPTPQWDAGANWHLAFFTVPQVAEWAFKGRERELLTWFFWHLSHNEAAVSPAHFEEYVRQISKPGALRAGIEYYAAVWRDAEDNKALAQTPLECPVLAIGGEASAGAWMPELFKPVA
ncbi:MAG: alpha/beta hydrolase, partial [Chitinophagales bacterium]|nr:alpha/beta hydrolase [Hyphomicrobiales bacterium]